MKNELLQISAAGAPTTGVSAADLSTAGVPTAVVNQYGEKNVYADRIDTVHQTINLNFPYMAGASDGGMQPSSRSINRDCYNLFVMGAEAFDHDHFMVSPERALSGYWTSEELRSELGELNDAAIEKIKSFPALFMQEAKNYYAKPSEDQQVFFGFVDGVKHQDNGIKIRCRLLWPIPMQQICDIGFELGMKNMTKAISEMNHTHWAIKRIDLIEALKDAGISLFGL